MLSLRLVDISEQGIKVEPRKTCSTTGRKIIYEWTPALRLAIQQVMDTRPKLDSSYLFCTRQGDSYLKSDGSTSGFDSIWQRTMHKALSSTNLKERFTEHDPRAKVASDATSTHARELMVSVV